MLVSIDSDIKMKVDKKLLEEYTLYISSHLIQVDTEEKAAFIRKRIKTAYHLLNKAFPNFNDAFPHQVKFSMLYESFEQDLITRPKKITNLTLDAHLTL